MLNPKQLKQELKDIALVAVATALVMAAVLWGMDLANTNNLKNLQHYEWIQIRS